MSFKNNTRHYNNIQFLGAGMIHPNMATMLSLLVTDAKINTDCLNKALKIAVNKYLWCFYLHGKFYKIVS